MSTVSNNYSGVEKADVEEVFGFDNVYGAVAKTDAAEVEGYSASALDAMMGYANDNFGEMICSVYLREDEEYGPNIDIIMLLISLGISKLGTILSLNIDWGIFGDAFGWLGYLSFVSLPVPNVNSLTIKWIVGTALHCVQPMCFLRMVWLAAEHQQSVPAALHILKPFVHMELQPRAAIFTPLCIVLWCIFAVLFSVFSAFSSHLVAGFLLLFLGCPALYFTLVGLFRFKTWEFVNLRYPDVLKQRQYENHCLKEGSFLLFLFVASYPFVMNYLIALLQLWRNHNTVENGFLIVSFVVFGILPLVFLYCVIDNITADRTFRMFRSQLVDSFTDQQMYTKVVLLFESVVFSSLIVLGSTSDITRLAGGLIVSVVFLLHALLTQPYVGRVETLSDLIVRGCSTATVLLGLVIAITDSTHMAISVVLITISSIGGMWFIYTLDIKDVLLSKFFLVLQLYAQSKALKYDVNTIKSLSSKQINRLIHSPIELYVLSPTQKIYFAVYRKFDFFKGDLIKSLRDLGISWLELQQAGYSVASMRSLGFSDDELVRVDASLNDMGNRSDIRVLFEDVYEASATELGEGAPRTLLRLHELGALYKDMGEHTLAMETLHKCWQRRQSDLGKEHADTLTSQEYIGEYWLELGRSSDATGMLRDCLEQRVKILGESHVDTLTTMKALGKNFQDVNCSKEAVMVLYSRLWHTVGNARCENLRSDHPSTLQARIDVAHALLAAGRHMDVEALQLSRVLNRQITLFGPANTTTFDLVDDVADVYIKLGRINEAMALELDNVAEKTATLGPLHSGTIASIFQLAAIYVDLGKTKELEELKLEEIVKILQENLSETHPTTVSSLVKLGGLYSTIGKYEASAALMQKCYETRCETLGRDHELTVGVANNLAVLLDTMGRREQALGIYKECVAVTVQKLGEHHVNALGMMLNLGSLVQNLGDLVTAKELYSKVYTVGCEYYSARHPVTMSAFDALGAIHMLKEEWGEAVAVFEASTVARAFTQDESHPSYLAAIDSLAACLKYLDKRDEALRLYEKVCALRLANYGRFHIETIKVNIGKCVIMAEMGQGLGALKIAKQCIADATKVSGPHHPYVIEYISVLGHIYVNLNDLSNGLFYIEKALEMYRTVLIYDENHFKVRGMLQKKDWIEARMNERNGTLNVSSACGADVDSTSNSANITKIQEFQKSYQVAQVLFNENKLVEAFAVYQPMLNDMVLLNVVSTPEGQQHQVAAMLMQAKLNFCVLLCKCNQIADAVPIFEGLVVEMLNANGPPEAVGAVRKMYQDALMKTNNHEKLCASFTEEFLYYEQRGAAGTAAGIGAINGRAGLYIQLKDFVRAAEDYHVVLELLVAVQGQEHPETKLAIESTVKLFADQGIVFEPFSSAAV